MYVHVPMESVPGTVWVQTPAQQPPTIISDEWRTNFFGSLTNVLADAFADPDGDGQNNLQEFLARTVPTDLRFQSLGTEWRANLRAFRLRWFGMPGRQYVVEAAPSLEGPWQPVSEMLRGDGNPLSADAPRPDLRSLFYRIRVVGP
jgi:hypothetical protein